ncbi:hypothetical protein ACQ4WX_36405 [Streptomyces lasalocidi]
MGALDDRVGAAAAAGAARHPARPADLAFLGTGGHPDGLLAARFDTGGVVLAAEVVRADDGPRPLGAAQRAALTGVPDDGSAHTRTVPGLGTYRVTALDADGVRVLARPAPGRRTAHPRPARAHRGRGRRYRPPPRERRLRPRRPPRGCTRSAIAAAHRGRLDVRSEPGRTEFRIELPAARQPRRTGPAAGYGSACSAQITLP